MNRSVLEQHEILLLLAVQRWWLAAVNRQAQASDILESLHTLCTAWAWGISSCHHPKKFMPAPHQFSISQKYCCISDTGLCLWYNKASGSDRFCSGNFQRLPSYAWSVGRQLPSCPQDLQLCYAYWQSHLRLCFESSCSKNSNIMNSKAQAYLFRS